MENLFGHPPRPKNTANGEEASHSYRFHRLQHNLLYDFHSIFSKGRSIAQNQGGSIRLEGASLLSKRYRAAIKRSVKRLERVDNFNAEQSQARVQQLGEELCSFELIWSLIEAVIFRPSQNLIVIDLLEWARENFLSAPLVPNVQSGRFGETNFLGSIMEEMMQREKPEEHDLYWNAVIRQALCADFPSVITLLQFHSAFKSDEVLAKMVKIMQAANCALFKHDRSNCEEFLMVQKKVRDLATQKHLFRLHGNLGVICSLMIGDRGTFKKYFDLFRPNWFEVLPAFILYFFPTHGGDQMPKVVENFLSLVAIQKTKLSQLELTILSVVELDLIQALRIICAGGNSVCWFATHLIDLLHFHDPNFLNPISSSSVSTGYINDIGKDLSDLHLCSRLLVEYAQFLFRDDQLWEIAPDYLGASELDDGGQMLDRLVAQQNWNDDTSMAERLLTICDRFELRMAREDILRSLTLKFCRQGEWSCALGWALRMSSNELTVRVARRILQGAILADRIGQMRIFDALADQFVDSAELVLLYKFYTFKRRLIEGELRIAVQIIQELFVDNSSPAEFHLVLFEEMAQILATFQQPLVGLDALEMGQQMGVPGLDRDAIQDMFRALSMFQLQQQLLTSSATVRATKESDSATSKALFPPANTAMIPSAEVSERIFDLMDTLRPMLAQALANCSVH